MSVQIGDVIAADVSGETDLQTRPEVHRLGGYQEGGYLSDGSYTGGLGITVCGKKQATRGHGWWAVSRDNAYQQEKIASGEWPICSVCLPTGLS